MISKEQATKTLRRMVKGGMIERMPKKSTDARFLLALAAISFMPRVRYTEQQVNDHLIQWLDGFTCPIGMDHVTVRRCLVDEFFLLRDASGSFYTTNSAVIATVLEPGARSIRPLDIFVEVQREREERKRVHSNAER